ncbi:TIM-barrel domain-containing protein [Labedaea rhizosphaerae]|uniref:Glycosyl hydrolase family 31 n=1 Tax=Labedaea rhizosphaerae TaxID=598644 RepID=A0A4R6S8C6_LABRH|nr:TIM-barrel domain-containing protein [Labedaea rhizosphaerae]TDP95106.1 glycosyl hydrolase family 31 [Labedaea rhizosphaerae]
MARRRFRTLLIAAALAVGGLTVLSVPATAAIAAGQLGDVTAFTGTDGDYTVDAGAAKLRLKFYDDQVLRAWLAPDGTFTDPANGAITVGEGAFKGAKPAVADKGDHYEIRTADVVLHVAKHPLTLALYRTDGTKLFSETKPLAWTDKATTQSLTRGAQEQFFGAGEQNGSFSFRDKTVQVANSFNWNEGGYNNSQPFYVSSAGYGVFRNTFAPGAYSFTDPVATTENEQRFDAFYFAGPSMKDVIGQYTQLVGRPFMPPVYGLELGDSDCYLHNANRGERHTMDAVDVADGYKANGMPNGWMLVNDGYGCGYENLPQVGAGLHADNMQMGLWTENGLANAEEEAKAGVTVRKLDVAWVGPGYKFALDGCMQAKGTIEDYTAARGFVWQPNSWAGAQRCAVLWSGDQSGSYDYTRWQIPTYAGATMSGIAYNTGDVDGIFGGSAKTYVRDLQFKSMLPVVMTMDGWAPSDKQPWRYGEPYTAINRKYLLLKEQLIPYMYTLAAQARDTGVGPTRPLVLEYPDDPNTWGDNTKYEFMAGSDFLVAPVYQDTSVRDGIYLPKGDWVDYWSGQVHPGQSTLDGYAAPLDTLPMFVKGGAIVPMWPQGTTSWQTRDKGKLNLDIYPQGHSSYSLYEDDGVTRQYANGRSATQQFTVDAPKSGHGKVSVHIGASRGSYDGKAPARSYQLSVHTGTAPGAVKAGNVTLAHLTTKDAFDKAATGWFYDPADRGGVISVKTPVVSANGTLDVTLPGTTAVGGAHPYDGNAPVSATAPGIMAPGKASTVTASVTNKTGAQLKDVELALPVPAGWTVTGESTTAATLGPDEKQTATFTVTPAADAKPDTYLLQPKATYTAHGAKQEVSGAAQTQVPYGSLAATFNNVGVTTAANPAPGNLDGGGDSFVAEKLAAAGVTPGGTVSADGVTFTWPDVQPGQANNLAASGETVAISGQGGSLAVLGTGTSGSATGTVTIHYADGTKTTQPLGFANWCCLDPTAYGSKIAVKMLGRNTPKGPANATTEYRIFTNRVPLDATKPVVAVTFPAQSTIHVFATAIT